MTLQGRVQAEAFYKQTSSYTHSVFPGRFFPSALAFVQQHSAFLGLKVLCTQHLGLLGKAVLPIKSETQLNSCSLLSPAQDSSKLPCPSEESSHLLNKGKCHANNSMETNWLPCWIAAKFRLSTQKTCLGQSYTLSTRATWQLALVYMFSKTRGFWWGVDTPQKKWI